MKMIYLCYLESAFLMAFGIAMVYMFLHEQIYDPRVFIDAKIYEPTLWIKLTEAGIAVGLSVLGFIGVVVSGYQIIKAKED